MSNTEGKHDASEGDYLQTANKSNVPWYRPDISSKLSEETRSLLESYSHIPREQQLQHVHQIRDQAFAVRPYPCTGLGAFLAPQLCRLPVYGEVVERLKAGGTMIDFGCFVGHDLRRLVHDGAPSSRLYGVDIANHWDVGFDMFRDRDSFAATFIEADVLATDPPESLRSLRGAADVVATSQLLHQWNWPGQVRACAAMIAYAKPGALFIGNQIGQEKAEEFTNTKMKMTVWWHNPESFAKMLDEVGHLTDTKWETEARLVTFEDMGWEDGDRAWISPDVKILEFAARRVQ